ncbi:MAG: ABC transporter ATP-binding protein/permease [Eubacterium sp.]|nr:ABC transporter ATP-binding protein/permease [Eubacterium sp.]
MEWAGPKKKNYVASVLLAICCVTCRLLPYFVMAELVGQIVDGNKDLNYYIGRLGLMVGLFAIAEIFNGFSTTMSHKATFAVLGGIRKACCDKLGNMPLGDVKDTPSGTFKSIIVERVDSIETTLAHVVPEVTSNGIAPDVVLIYMFMIDWHLALISFIPVVVGLIISLGMFVGYEENYGRTVRGCKAINATAVEYINGIEVIKAFGKTESAYERFVADAKECAYSFIDWMRKCIFPQVSMLVLMPYAFLTLLPFGAKFVADGSLALADFVVFAILSLGVTGPLIRLGGYFDDIAKVGIIIKEVAGVLESRELERPGESQKLPEGYDIHLEDVHFSYKEEEVLHGINLDFPSDTVCALVGPSGSGKSTIAKLVASLWDVDSGQVKIGDINVKDLALEDYNRLVAYVSQDNYLFNQSIRENIRMGRPGATDQEVEEVAKKSGCYDFIMNLEDGFDTLVGGAGGHLSGGERQRISIARAMMKDAPIIILDEATAYTDPESEALIQRSLAKLSQGKTVIVIAHRLSTIKDVDKIIVIKEGQVEAAGKHQDLLDTCPLYRDMWQAHMSVKDTAEEVEIHA